MKRRLSLVFAGAAVLVLLLLLLRRGTPAWFSVLEPPAKAVFAVLWAVVFLGVYVFPIVVYSTR